MTYLLVIHTRDMEELLPEGGAPFPKEPLTLRSLFWVMGDGASGKRAFGRACFESIAHTLPVARSLSWMLGVSHPLSIGAAPPVQSFATRFTRPPCCSDVGGAHSSGGSVLAVCEWRMSVVLGDG